MFEILEHPADIGFRATGKSKEELFETAALALVSVAMETDRVEPRHSYRLEAAGGDLEALLVNWLSETLYWLDGERIAFRNFRVEELTPGRVRGYGQGEPQDAARHPAKLIVKAVTYHQLKIVESPEGWTAEVYLDI